MCKLFLNSRKWIASKTPHILFIWYVLEKNPLPIEKWPVTSVTITIYTSVWNMNIFPLKNSKKPKILDSLKTNETTKFQH